jgi:two-component system response regulator YesN
MEYFQKDNNIISLLYVEDEPVIRGLIQKVISRKFPTMKIHLAEDGKAGLELFKKICPDILLADINLPELNGILMVSEIRKLNPKTEIIIISGQEKVCYESDCVKFGISRYLNKPILHEELFKAIEDSIACITSKRKLRQLLIQDEDKEVLIPQVVFQS